MKRILSTALMGCSALAAASAFAGEGYLVANVTLRAGPDSSYPSVVGLRAGTPVGIEGCVDGWSWCDVTTGADRGWVSANYLQEEYQGRRVLVPQYGVQIGIPVVTFVFGNYWDSYYRDRSWYGNREHWSHVHPHYSSYGGSHGTSYANSYGGSHGTSHGGSTYVVAPNQAHTSSGYHTSGARQTTVVTTQPAYQGSHAQTTYRSGHVQSASMERTQQSHAYRAPASERNMNPPRSASGEQHSAAGQARAAEVHDRNLAKAQQKAASGHNQNAEKAPHKDKPEKDHGGGKDKNQN